MHVVLTSLVCLQCGRDVGCLERSLGQGGYPRLLFRPAGTAVARRVYRQSFRCAACHGVAIADDVRPVQLEEPIDWSLERPRRGRPPAWLVAKRRRDRQ